MNLRWLLGSVLLVAMSTAANAVSLEGKWRNTNNGNDVYIWRADYCKCIALVEISPSNKAVVEV
jgi:hypothetical protein